MAAARERLDPVEVVGVGDPASIVPAHLVLTPAIRHRNTDPRPGSSRPRSIPTLMYSSPVADSIERVRAVWTDAQTRPAGRPARRSGAARRTAPTARRATRTARRRPARRPSRPTPRTARPGRRPRQQRPGEQDQRRLGQLGRHQVPVAQDHRREDPADRRADDGQLDEQRARRRAARRPSRARRTAASRPRQPAPPTRGRRRRRSGRRASDDRGDGEPAEQSRATRRGASQAGSTGDRRVPSDGAGAPSRDQREDPEAERADRREARGSRASPSSAAGAGRPRRYEPSARPVRTVQLMKARFWAIAARALPSVAGTPPARSRGGPARSRRCSIGARR